MEKNICLVDSWAKDIAKRDSILMTNYYSEDSILLATFENLLEGKSGVKKYFDSFLSKEGLGCEILDKYYLVNTEILQVCSGTYKFNYISDGNTKEVFARFTFAFKNHKIVTHHSSVNPEL
ncbi:MAG: hypothetical protein CMP58_02475 [Flavobacteriales bacterium]|nr:hypothetical protein [Flavobacteriales bacterium]